MLNLRKRHFSRHRAGHNKHDELHFDIQKARVYLCAVELCRPRNTGSTIFIGLKYAVTLSDRFLRGV